MENNANYAIVGALATAVVVAFLGFVFWFAGPSSNAATNQYDVVFTGTVSGISRGTDVLFNGIKVGQVNEVSLDPNDTTRVVARISVDANAPVKADTRVVMGFQGLTGAGSLQLSGGTNGAGAPVPPPGSTVPVLYAQVSDFQSILDGMTTTVNGVSAAVNRINTLLDTNDAKLNATIANVETFTAALASNSEGVEGFLDSIADASRQIGPMATQIGTLSDDLRALVAAIPPEDVAKAVADVTTFTESLSRNSGQIDEFFNTTSTLANNLTDLTKGLSASVGVIDKVAAEIDPEVVGRVLANVDTFSTEMTTVTADLRKLLAAIPPEQVTEVVDNVAVFTGTLSRNSGQIDTFFASTSGLTKSVTDMIDGLKSSVAVIDKVVAQIDPDLVGRVLENVDSFSTALGDNAANVDTIVANINKVSDNLVGAAQRVDAILSQVDSAVAGAEGQGMFGEIGEAANSVRALADQLTASTAGIAAGLNNFANRGLPEYSALAAEARATLQRLDRVVRNLEANPQALIFGGETVRDYNKQ